MKYWLSHLPLEVWVDVYRYPWISRGELGRIVDRFGNHKFAEYLQFFLHDWGKRQLDELYLHKDGMYQIVKHRLLHVDFPLTPLPQNVKSFQLISIHHFNAQTIAFLRQIGPLLTDVNLGLYGISPNNMENLRLILTNLLPLLNGIHSLFCDVQVMLSVKQCFCDKWDNLKMLEIVHFEDKGLDGAALEATVDSLTDWLTSSPGPKLCDARIYIGNTFGPQISAAIRKQFYAAKELSATSCRLHKSQRSRE